MEELLRTLKVYCNSKQDHALNGLIDKLIEKHNQRLDPVQVIDLYLENPQNTFEVNETLLSMKSKFNVGTLLT